MLNFFSMYGKIKHTEKLSHILCTVSVFVFGGLYYALLEILWRGYTHPSMIVLGGVAFIIAYFVFDKRVRLPYAVKCIVCSVLITGAELACGLIVNLWLGWDVWDYSSLPFNLLGQICLLYSCFWALLSAPCGFMCICVHKLFDLRLRKREEVL